MMRSVRHTGYTVRSMEASLEFYTELLGLELIWRRDEPIDFVGRIVGYPGGHVRLAFLKCPGDEHVLELLQYVEPVGVPLDVRERCNPGSHHLCFEVDDIWAEYRRLEPLGVDFVSEPVLITSGVNQGAWAVYLFDPDGISCELWQSAVKVSD
jgi:lactoylglutathione lyase